MISPVSDNTRGSTGDTSDSESSSDNLYEPKPPKGERRRLQNRLNRKTHRKKLKLTAARACKKKIVSIIF
jgi:hypothetical protein